MLASAVSFAVLSMCIHTPWNSADFEPVAADDDHVQFELPSHSRPTSDYINHVYSGYSFDISSSEEDPSRDCTELRLIVPWEELRSFQREYPNATLAALFKPDSDRLLECAGGPLTPQQRFIVRGDLGRIEVEALRRSTATDDHQNSSHAGTLPPPNAPDKTGHSKARIPSTVSVARIAARGYRSYHRYVRRSKNLELADEPIVEAGNKTAAVGGFLARYAQIGGWYKGTFYGRPVRLKSDFVSSATLDKGTPCDAPASYNFLAATQSARGGTSGDDCGHMVGHQLGGPGDLSSGHLIFSQNRVVNQGGFRKYETSAYNLARQGGRFILIQDFAYQSSGRRPSSVEYAIECDRCSQACMSQLGLTNGKISKNFTNCWQPNLIWNWDQRVHHKDVRPTRVSNGEHVTSVMYFEHEGAFVQWDVAFPYVDTYTFTLHYSSPSRPTEIEFSVNDGSIETQMYTLPQRSRIGKFQFTMRISNSAGIFEIRTPNHSDLNLKHVTVVNTNCNPS